MPYWSIILLDCLVILFSGLLVYALNNGIFATMGIFWHLSLTWGVCLVPYLVGFRLFRTYSGIIRYSSFVDLQRVGFAVLFGVVCVVTFQEFTDFSPYLVYIRKRDLVLSSLLAMSLMWAMLEPKLAILDETDSGLDIDALRIVAHGVNQLRTPENAAIVITHYQRLLDYIKPDVVHVLYKGRIVKTAGPELALELEEKGYDWIKKEMGDE